MKWHNELCNSKLGEIKHNHERVTKDTSIPGLGNSSSLFPLHLSLMFQGFVPDRDELDGDDEPEHHHRGRGDGRISRCRGDGNVVYMC